MVLLNVVRRAWPPCTATNSETKQRQAEGSSRSTQSESGEERKRIQRAISRTVREGEPTQFDGVIVEVRRKRRQYRVTVRPASE